FDTGIKTAGGVGGGPGRRERHFDDADGVTGGVEINFSCPVGAVSDLKFGLEAQAIRDEADETRARRTAERSEADNAWLERRGHENIRREGGRRRRFDHRHDAWAGTVRLRAVGNGNEAVCGSVDDDVHVGEMLESGSRSG